MKRLFAVLAVVLVGSLAPRLATASTTSGQHVFTTAAFEPAYNGKTGQEIYLRIPTKATIKPDAPWSPIYLPLYPKSSTLTTFDCLPTNCNHANVVPWSLVTFLGLQSVYPKGTISTRDGSFSGGLVKGHDHLTTGRRSRSVRHVYLVLFTVRGVADGAINREITTLAAMRQAIARGDMLDPVDAQSVIQAFVVPKSMYLTGQ